MVDPVCQGWSFPTLGFTWILREEFVPVTYFSTSAWFLTEGRGPRLSTRRPMQHVVWFVVFILNFTCVFRFPPTSTFIVTPTLDRLPTKAEDPYPTMRRLVITRQTLTWKFRDHGVFYINCIALTFVKTFINFWHLTM